MNNDIPTLQDVIRALDKYDPRTHVTLYRNPSKDCDRLEYDGSDIRVSPKGVHLTVTVRAGDHPNRAELAQSVLDTLYPETRREAMVKGPREPFSERDATLRALRAYELADKLYAMARDGMVEEEVLTRLTIFINSWGQGQRDDGYNEAKTELEDEVDKRVRQRITKSLGRVLQELRDEASGAPPKYCVKCSGPVLNPQLEGEERCRNCADDVVARPPKTTTPLAGTLPKTEVEDVQAPPEFHIWVKLRGETPTYLGTDYGEDFPAACRQLLLSPGRSAAVREQYDRVANTFKGQPLYAGTSISDGTKAADTPPPPDERNKLYEVWTTTEGGTLYFLGADFGTSFEDACARLFSDPMRREVVRHAYNRAKNTYKGHPLRDSRRGSPRLGATRS